MTHDPQRARCTTTARYRDQGVVLPEGNTSGEAYDHVCLRGTAHGAHAGAVRHAGVPPRLVVRVLLHCRRWLQRLADAVVPARFVVAEQAVSLGKTHLLGLAARLRIADLLACEPCTAEELAQATGTHPDAMHRMMRALVASNVFALDALTGQFRNNRLSEVLRTCNPRSARHFVEYFSTQSNVLAWADAEETLRTGTNAFERVHGMSVWDWLASHPAEERLFADAMAARTADDAAAIVAVYPFGDVHRVCDVAGGRGTLLAHVLAAHPRLCGVLFEAPGVARMARDLLHACRVVDRLEIVSGNVFENVPGGCDTYIVKDILHDWDDARALQILGNVRRVMRPGRRVLICETIVERMETALPGALMDVQMLMVCSGGRQRSRGEFATLLQQAGFACTRVLDTPLPISIVEGVAV